MWARGLIVVKLWSSSSTVDKASLFWVVGGILLDAGAPNSLDVVLCEASKDRPGRVWLVVAEAESKPRSLALRS